MFDYAEIDSWEFESNGRKFKATVVEDSDNPAPWDNEDGHGPVSDWRAGGYHGARKAPGEIVLCESARMYRLYDFAEACRIARRDGWGFLPGELKTRELPGGQWRAVCDGPGFKFAAEAPDINAAIRAVYRQHKESFPSARAYAAAAAMADFKRLAAWCRDDWRYVGVVVCEICPHCGEAMSDETESLWGIESDAGDYLREVAAELAEELTARGAAN